MICLEGEVTNPVSIQIKDLTELAFHEGVTTSADDFRLSKRLDVRRYASDVISTRIAKPVTGGVHK
jgi:hypothetical protein